MRDCAIIMTAPSVLALLAGHKTMTRRMAWKICRHCKGDALDRYQGRHIIDESTCPKCEGGYVPTNWQKLHHYIQGGGSARIYIKESFQVVNGRVMCRADWHKFATDQGWDNIPDKDKDPGGWTSARYMPRRESRITIVDVQSKMEPLIWITEDDARAEGLGRITKDQGRTWKYGTPDRDGFPGGDDIGWPWQKWSIQPRIAFKRLWNSIDGPDAWSDNPQVIALSGRVVIRNIDLDGL